jgi:formiminoglutamase
LLLSPKFDVFMLPMDTLKPTDSSLFFSRRDPSDPRLGEIALKSSGTEQVSIMGYPDDEGIQLNGGRVGAAQGPREIRHWLYRMTPHPRRGIKSFFDGGDLASKVALSERHEMARQIVGQRLLNKVQVLTFGGGNDYAYADGMGFLDRYKDSQPLVINIDAHLDVRGTEKGLNSGTPFFRLLESGVRFDFLELGTQSHCNAKDHWNYVENRGGKIISMDEILESGLPLTEVVTRSVGDWLLRPRPTFLAIDMDAFSWPYAMNTSAAWPLGLDPHQFWTLLNILLRRLDVRVMGIYEVAPPLENGPGTAKLAAQWAHCFLHV